MTPGWLLTSLALPALGAIGAAVLLRRHEPGAYLITLLNAILPGTGLAAGGRPTLEVVLGVLFAQASLLVIGGTDQLWMYVPCMMVGGVWGLSHTHLNPLLPAAESEATRLRQELAVTGSQQRTARPQPTPESRRAEAETQVETSYSVEVRCTECGASVAVPVLHRMAHCSYCDSNHLVVGHDETLSVTLPERVGDEAVLREALLDHYRYQHYLKLYRRAVAPLARSATEAGADGALIDRPEIDAAAAVAEAAVSRKADAYRTKLAGSLHVARTLHFLAPYRHGMGTLYQAAFGRSQKDQEKVLRFAMGTLEAAVIGTPAVDLPPMGRLSYLRALLPVASCPRDIPALPLEGDDSDLEHAFGDYENRRLVREIQVIRLGSKFVREVTAVVWRPWWIAEVRGPSIDDTLLLDAASGSVVGPAPVLDDRLFGKLPESALDPGTGFRFVPMECPTCGHEFLFDPDAVLHFCRNCHRLCGVRSGKKFEVGYAHLPRPPEGEWDMVPFWQFPLRLRTGDGELITDLMRLKDGIDGRLDAVDEATPPRQHALFVPAIRCVNPRLMANAFNRLFLYAVRQRPPEAASRFPLEARPNPWAVSLSETEARDLAPLYLANAFSRRDITRVNVHQVASWLFEAKQEASGRIAYLPVPRSVTEPFRRYVGRYRGNAIGRVAGRS